MDVTQISDQELLQRLTQLDRELYDEPAEGWANWPTTPEQARHGAELADAMQATEQEIERRFGEGANDVLASYWTAAHADGADGDRQAHEDPQTLIEIANGTHQHASVNGGTCKCGVLPQYIQ